MKLLKKLGMGTTALVALFAAGVFVSAGGSPAAAAARCTTIITTIGTVTSTVISTVTQTVTVTTGTTGTTTTPTTTCDIIANPGDATLQAVVDTATAGKTVCLHGGTYSDSGAGGRVLLFSAISGTASAPITVTSYPGETATLCG